MLVLVASCSKLLVLRFRLPVDGNVGIGIFPESEKVLIRLARGFLVAHHNSDLRPGRSIRKPSASEAVTKLSAFEHFGKNVAFKFD